MSSSLSRSATCSRGAALGSRSACSPRRIETALAADRLLPACDRRTDTIIAWLMFYAGNTGLITRLVAGIKPLCRRYALMYGVYCIQVRAPSRLLSWYVPLVLTTREDPRASTPLLIPSSLHTPGRSTSWLSRWSWRKVSVHGRPIPKCEDHPLVKQFTSTHTLQCERSPSVQLRKAHRPPTTGSTRANHCIEEATTRQRIRTHCCCASRRG